jgi:hypothetical protein
MPGGKATIPIHTQMSEALAGGIAFQNPDSGNNVSRET